MVRPHLPRRGWLGLGLASAALAFAQVEGMAFGSALAPIFWTGVVLFLDALAERVRGRSLFAAEPQVAVWAAVLSIFLWAGLEQLNQQIPVWANVGWPPRELTRYALLGWLFATTVPAMLELMEIFGSSDRSRRMFPAAPGPCAAATARALGPAAIALSCVPGLLQNDSWRFSLAVLGIWAAGEGFGAWLALPGTLVDSDRFIRESGAGLIWLILEAAANLTFPSGRMLIVFEGLNAAILPAALFFGPTLLRAYRAAAAVLRLPADGTSSADAPISLFEDSPDR